MIGSRVSSLATIFANMSAECRHGVYVWWLTAATLSGIMLIALTRTGEVAQSAVTSMASTLTFLVTTYLGIEAIGKSQIMNKFADRIAGNSADTVITTTTTKQDDPSGPVSTSSVVTASTSSTPTAAAVVAAVIPTVAQTAASPMTVETVNINSEKTTVNEKK